MQFRQTIIIRFIFAQLFSIMDENISFNSQKPVLYDYEKNTFIHRVINAQWHAKFGLHFRHPVEPGCIMGGKSSTSCLKQYRVARGNFVLDQSAHLLTISL